ncbi:transglutaminase domain-containing protein [Lysinibacillus sp. NPDC097287]|uniref:transglutaminase domain-containing protein n=1 Tax=Lysinibacillus sp. NPDC097287 TaxID=3364144 RepID=UPI00382F7AEC
MKKWLLSSAALLMLSPTVAYGHGTDSYANEGTSKVAYNVVASSAITSWEQVANEIAKQMNTFATDINLSYKGSMDNFSDNALAAFDKAKQQAVYAGEHIESTSVSTDSVGNIKLKIKYLTNKAQEEIVQKKVDQVLANIITPSMTTFEKVKVVNDYIVSNAKYGESTKSSPHSAHALLMEGQAVCQGYALLTYKMLNQIGVDVQYVVGFVNGNEAHAWNLVKIDGKWYHLDTTWNDPLPNRVGASSYDYFLVTDTQLKKDHTWVTSDYPAATSTTYSYMQNVHYAHQINNSLYFSNKADNNKLYKLDLGTGKKVKLADTRVLYIVGAGDAIYYSDFGNGGYLTKMNIKTLKTEVLVKNAVTDLMIKGENLVYKIASKEQKIKIDVPTKSSATQKK